MLVEPLASHLGDGDAHGLGDLDDVADDLVGVAFGVELDRHPHFVDATLAGDEQLANRLSTLYLLATQRLVDRPVALVARRGDATGAAGASRRVLAGAGDAAVAGGTAGATAAGTCCTGAAGACAATAGFGLAAAEAATDIAGPATGAATGALVADWFAWFHRSCPCSYSSSGAATMTATAHTAMPS